MPGPAESKTPMDSAGVSSVREICPPLIVKTPPLIVIRSLTSGVVSVAVLPICMAKVPPVFRVRPPARVSVPTSEARRFPGATMPPVPTVRRAPRVSFETRVPALAPPTVTAELVRALLRMRVLVPCTVVSPARVLLSPSTVSVPPP